MQAEVDFLGQLHHPNLVKLIGYCIEDDQRLLVYEFMTRGSLENHLFRSKFCLCQSTVLDFLALFMLEKRYVYTNQSEVVNSNLAKCLQGTIPLPWSNRIKIATGAAKGLAFLHGGTEPIIYRDFKTSNILLDTVSKYIFL